MSPDVFITIVFGGFAVLAALTAALVLFWRHRRHEAADEAARAAVGAPERDVERGRHAAVH